MVAISLGLIEFWNLTNAMPQPSNAMTRTKSLRPEPRDGDATRARLLDIAFAEVHAHGYQGLRVDSLLEKAKLTKGAFYHHFQSKQALGLAIIDEVLAGMAELVWGQHLAQFDDPLLGIESSINFAVSMLGERCTTLGCPINNLAQEMSGIDDAFRVRLDTVFKNIVANIAAALERGKRHGIVRADVETTAAATFILAGTEGTVGLAKSARSPAVLDLAMREMKRYLDSLRADGRATSGGT